MLPVQPVQSVKCMQDLLLGHASATQPLQQIYLLNREPRLLAELRHPAAGQERKKTRQVERQKEKIKVGGRNARGS